MLDLTIAVASMLANAVNILKLYDTEDKVRVGETTPEYKPNPEFEALKQDFKSYHKSSSIFGTRKMNGNKIKEEEILHEVRLNILEEQRHYLCKHLNPQDHFAYLRSKHLLTREDEELIKSEVTSKRRAERFLDILIQKGPNCYKSLVDALLKNGTQLFLAEKLNKEYERKKINLHNLLTGSEPMDPRGDIGVDPASLPRPTVGSIENQNSYKSHIDSASSSLTTYKSSYISSNDSNA